MPKITCPCCGNAEIDVEIDPGEPAITSGPSDKWYPGSPPQLADWNPDCECGVFLERLEKELNSEFDIISNIFNRYADSIEEAALELPIPDEYDDPNCP